MTEPKTRTRDPAATRRALLAEAANLFAERGFEGATTELLAARAGVNKAMISYHFGGKQGLYFAVILAAVEAAQERLEPIRTGKLSPDERLDGFIITFMEFVDEHPYFPAIILREWMAAGRNLGQEVLEVFFGFFRFVRDTLVEGQKLGVFRALDPHATHVSLVGSMMMFFVSRPVRERLERENKLPAPSFSREEYTRVVRDIFLGALRSESP